MTMARVAENRVGISSPRKTKSASKDSGVIRRIPPGRFRARALTDCEMSPCHGWTGNSAAVAQLFHALELVVDQCPKRTHID